MSWPEPGDYPAAREWLRDKIGVSDDEFEALSEMERMRAFKVAGVAQLDVAYDVMDALDSALKDGDDLDDFKAAVEEALLEAWAGSVDDPAARIEVILRTNLQGAYSAGRFEGATDDDVLEDRPYWRFDAIVDGRETKVCHDADGTVLPADHPWWKTHYAPLHHNCRSDVTSLTPEEAEAEGITKSPTSKAASEGFGKFPTAENEWEPDLSKYPDDLVEAHNEKPDDESE